MQWDAVRRQVGAAAVLTFNSFVGPFGPTLRLAVPRTAHQLTLAAVVDECVRLLLLVWLNAQCTPQCRVPSIRRPIGLPLCRTSPRFASRLGLFLTDFTTLIHSAH